MDNRLKFMTGLRSGVVGLNHNMRNPFLGSRFTGHEIGRFGLGFGLGSIAARNAQDTYHRLKYGEIGGAMLSAALTASAGYGAYQVYMNKDATSRVLNFASKKLGGMIGNLRPRI